MKTLTTLLLAVFGLALPLLADTEISHVDAAQAAKLVQSKAVSVLDVRTADEFKTGHIAGAKNLDFTEDSFPADAAKLDRQTTWLVHCASGKRSTASLEVLKKLGFAKVVHLDGGLNAWKKAGNAVEK